MINKGVIELTTQEMLRCKKCPYLTEDDDGNWVCKECNKKIDEVTDEDCYIENPN